MSSRPSSRPPSRSTRSSSAAQRPVFVRHSPPPPAFTPEGTDQEFEPCATTAAFFLYAQRNIILILHHDSLTIERRLDLHREDVQWIAVDNVSERGSGRLAVSFDTGKTAIVWDILTGREVARFSAYENMRVASFMRNGNIAFGNDQGNIILFEPSTSEHISARTIFDPITAVAPASDCRTFAIGYLNGSILIATLQPSFTIIHTLNTTRAPSKITGLAWHGSSSKQKTDMLATQTQDGDLRVWSVPKDHSDTLNIIRVLQRNGVAQTGPTWFSWSKNGRLLQLVDGETRSWDVRTKKVTYDVIPTIDGVKAIANYGPSASLFTLGRDHTVQQYDVNPSAPPLQVAAAQHVPANTPPTPPMYLDSQSLPQSRFLGPDASSQPGYTDTDSSADERGNLSPLQKIALEMDSLDALESEIRDKAMPLSPRSSQASSVSSRSSRKGGRRGRKYLYDQPESSRASTGTGHDDGTEFSFQLPTRSAHPSMSIRSVSSYAATHANGPSNIRTTNLRNPVPRNVNEVQELTATNDLFPFTKARLRDVAFRTPHYGEIVRTPELLQREMLSVVFGWHDDVRALISDELYRHQPGSASGVLLSRWLGEIGADDMSSLIGSESMTSSDWMLLALTSLGPDSKKKAGEAFVQRLLEKGDINPAVGVLLGLGEVEDAIEVYTSQEHWLEAVLLSCLMRGNDWKRVSHLLRNWGQAAVVSGDGELAVRCFSCTSIETSAPWSSPQAEEDVYRAHNEQRPLPQSVGATMSPTFSAPSRSGSGRLKAKNASLKLVTTFGNKGLPVQPTGRDLTVAPADTNTSVAVTPIGASALPSSAYPSSAHPDTALGPGQWRNALARNARDPSSARTATPGGWNRRKRLPSRADIDRAKQEAAELATPLTARNVVSQRSSSVSSINEPTTALRPTIYNAEPSLANSQDTHGDLPGPPPDAFTRLQQESRDSSSRSRDGQPNRLAVQVVKTEYTDELTPSSTGRLRSATFDGGISSPPLTGGSKASVRSRAADDYISSVDQARAAARQERTESRRRAESRKRGESKSGRASSRVREPSESRSRAANVRYIKPAKHSPSSPVPMSPEEIAQASQPHKIEPATTDDESFYKTSLTSPVESTRSGWSYRSESKHARGRASEDRAARGEHLPRTSSRAGTRGSSPDRLRVTTEDGRGRSAQRGPGSATRSPSSPLPVLQDKRAETEITLESERFHDRSKSVSRKTEDLQSRRQASRDRRERSASRKPTLRDEGSSGAPGLTSEVIAEEPASPRQSSDFRHALSRKQLAAKELEERRKSLARRPSAPQIPLPGETLPALSFTRPGMSARSNTELGDSPTSYLPPLSRSHTVDPDAMSKYGSMNKAGGTVAPFTPIGLPATPRAMRRHFSGDDERDRTPPVPDIRGKLSDLGSLSGSTLSQDTGTESNLSQVSSVIPIPDHWKSSVMTDQSKMTALTDAKSAVSQSSDTLGPLLPSTTYGQKDSTSASTLPAVGLHGATHPVFRPGLPSQPGRTASHMRKISPPDAIQLVERHDSVPSIDATLHQRDTFVVDVYASETDAEPPVLPELQHLAGPMPPPPPPLFAGRGHGASGVINIVMDDTAPGAAVDEKADEPTFPYAMQRAATTSPSLSAQHRRNQASMGESIGSRIRNIGDRMRSNSRNRAKSPLNEGKTSPYESILPPIPLPTTHHHQQHRRRESLGTAARAQSPYEQAMAAQSLHSIVGGGARPGISAPMLTDTTKLSETAIPPSSLPGSRAGSVVNGYRNPREIRANMPPGHMQQGSTGGFL